MRPRRTSHDEEFAGMDTFHLLQQGHASFNGQELDDDEWEAAKKERQEALARKRTPGFTATWPEGTPKGDST